MILLGLAHDAHLRLVNKQLILHGMDGSWVDLSWTERFPHVFLPFPALEKLSQALQDGF